MQKQDVFDVIYTHTEGEPLCIIHSGIPYPSGSSILQKRQFLKDNYDWLRCALMREPRGHRDMFGVFLTPPSSPEFDAGLIYIDGTEYSHMCGHGTIAVAMAMVALGLTKRGPGDRTTIRFETTAGLVVAEVANDGDRVEWTRFENVPAYVAQQDVALESAEYGPLKADIVWGGNYFGIVDLSATSLRISPENRLLPSAASVRAVRPTAVSGPPLLPLWLRRGAQDLADQGWRLFEPKASLARPRQIRAPQVPRSEAEGRRQWGRFLLVPFLVRTRKGTRPPVRRPASSVNKR
jgi:proline racemase